MSQHGATQALGGARLIAVLVFENGIIATEAVARSPADGSRATRTVQIHESRTVRSCQVATRAAIRAVGGATGPLLVEDDTATIYVPPAWHATEDSTGNLILEHEKEAA